MPIEPTPIAGDANVTLRLKEVSAVKNPEKVGKGEWTFAVTVNGLERWRSESPVGVGAGETVAVAGAIPIEVDAATVVLEVDVTATEHDALGVHQEAAGKEMLHRVAAFERDRGFTVELRGKDAQLALRFTVEVTGKA